MGCYATTPSANFPKLVIPAVGAFMLFDVVVFGLTLLRIVQIREYTHRSLIYISMYW